VTRPLSIIVTCGAILFSGCATTEPQPFETRITGMGDPGHFRFYVFGDPGLKLDPTIEQMNIPVYEKIRLGMRRYAEAELAKRGLCPRGFRGPDVVRAPERATMHSFFFVECL